MIGSARIRNWLDWSLVALVALAAVAAGFVREFSGDFHWHLVMGEQTLRTLHIATTDAFSHTMLGQPLINNAWLGDLLLALAFRAGGYAGCYGLRAACIVATLLLVVREGRRLGASTALPSAAFLFTLGWGLFVFYLRPEMFTLPALAALLHLLGQHERTGRMSWLAGALAVILFWANVHGSVLLGLLVVGIYSAASLFDRLVGVVAATRRQVLTLCALPLVALAVACVNPHGLTGALPFSTMSPLWMRNIADFQPLVVDPMLLVAAVVVVATSVAAGWEVSRFRLGVTIALAILALLHRRFALAALVSAIPLVSANAAVLAHRWPRTRLITLVGVVTTAAIALWGGLTLIVERDLFAEVGTDVAPDVYPEAACRFAREHVPAGKMINSGYVGSYLMWCLPGQPVFIDQRAWNLYPDAFYRDYLHAGQTPADFEPYADAHQVTWAFALYDPLAARLAEHPDIWRLVYFDDQALIYVRRPTDHAWDDGFVALEPGALPHLIQVTGDELARARTELAVQEARCPTCRRTLLARLAVDLAAGDTVDGQLAIDRLADFGESLEATFLIATALERDNAPGYAAVLYARMRVLGGDPVESRLLEARARAHAGDADSARRLLEEAAGYPGAAPAAHRAAIDLGLATP